MRLAAAACALAILVCVAVVGAVLAQKTSVPASVPVPALATPAPAPPTGPVVVIREVTEPAAAAAPKLTDGRASVPVAAQAPVAPAPIAAAPISAAPPAPVAAPPAAPIVVAQAPQPPRTTPAPAPAPAPAPPPAASAASCPGNPNALGVARTVEIDTTGGPGFGFEHFRQHDFLKNGEVVLTFDDGPWLNNTAAVLKALAEQCTKATFFAIGLHATYYPEILKQVDAAGHSVGSHTWSHKDLSRKPFDTDLEAAKAEVEKGISAVAMALGHPGASFFRFPALKHPPELVTYLGQRNIAMFSTDMDSFDFTMRRSEAVIKSVMTKLEKHGKGIVLMHDFQQHTAEALPELLKQLQAKGYKVVHLRSAQQVKTLPQYDEMVIKDQKLPTVSTRPTSTIIKEVTQ
jgi:peptidoglycan/xylan/chitin deacetylase (PgdA/CDA1 family)